MVWNIFNNVQFYVYYKAIFVLFGALLIISLFVDVKAISNEELFQISVISVIYSVVIWVFNEMLGIRQDQMNELRGQINIDYLGELKKVLAIHIIGVIIWLAVISLILIS